VAQACDRLIHGLGGNLLHFNWRRRQARADYRVISSTVPAPAIRCVLTTPCTLTAQAKTVAT
jgi:hypothetical protein